jgi:hypothetical protein
VMLHAPTSTAQPHAGVFAVVHVLFLLVTSVAFTPVEGKRMKNE